MRRATVTVLVAAGVGLSACSSGTGGDSRSATSSTPTSSSAPSTSGSTSAAGGQATAGSPSVVATGLEVPWGVAFLPDGNALVSERDTHRIVRVSPQGGKTDVGTVPGVKDDAGEGGLLGLALSPRFATDKTVFAYYTSDRDNRVVRFTYDGTGISGITAVFTGIPSAGNHNGGRIAFGPDGYLYVTAGDAAQPDRAPDRDYLGGKVLRMTAGGAPAPGNPDADSVVWTFGHRNPQGLAFAPGGKIYEAEFGQNTEDEINLLAGGNDYGWPGIEGDNGTAAGKTAPQTTFSTSDASPSGLDYAGGSLWLAALGGERLYRITVAGDSLGTPQALLEGKYGRLRTVVTAPDGALWVTTSNRDGRGSPANGDDRIIRIPLT